MIKLRCFSPGDDSDFSVDIDENMKVVYLKDAIKEENPQAFPNVSAHSLILYRIAVDISQHNSYHNILEEISKGRYEFTMKKRLWGPDAISKNFKTDSGKVIEVLVEYPPGGPINSRACSDAVLALTPGCRF